MTDTQSSRFQQGPFAAEVIYDTTLASTVVALSYADAQQPARSLLASVAPELGSNLFRLRVGEHELIYTDRETLRGRSFTGNFVLWPLPNRVRDKRYTYHGKEYSLASVDRHADAFLVHGLVFDQPWQFAEPVVDEDGVSVTTSIEMNEENPYYSSYPFPSRLSLTYTLTQNGLTITYEVLNQGSGSLPFGFALHPYFATLPDKNQTLVSVPARSVMQADDDLLPTGQLFDVSKLMYYMYDLRTPVPVACLKLDHVYTDLDPNTSAIIDYPQLALQLHIGATNDFTHAVIFTLDKAPFFCLEHQTCSTDAVNLAQQGPDGERIAHLLEVEAGDSYAGTLHYDVRFV